MSEASARLFEVQGLDHVAIAVSDLQKSAQWYHHVLGLERRYQKAWGEYPVMMCAGNSGVALFPAKANAQQELEREAEPATRHIAFKVDAVNYAAAKIALRSRGIVFQEQDHQVSHSIYFADPDGHRLEITTYDLKPSDKRTTRRLQNLSLTG